MQLAEVREPAPREYTTNLAKRHPTVEQRGYVFLTHAASAHMLPCRALVVRSCLTPGGVTVRLSEYQPCITTDF